MPSMPELVNHANPEVCNTVIEILTEGDNYVESVLWEQKEVHIESAEEQLAEAVPKAVVLYKWRTLDKRIAEIKARIASGDDSDAVISLLTKYQAARVAIAKAVGRLI